MIRVERRLLRHRDLVAIQVAPRSFTGSVTSLGRASRRSLDAFGSERGGAAICRSASLGRAIQPTGQSLVGLIGFPEAACPDLLIVSGSTRGQVKRLPPTLPRFGRLDLLLHIATHYACCALAHCTQYARELVILETATVSVPFSVSLTSRCRSTPLFESVSSSIPNCSTDCSCAD